MRRLQACLVAMVVVAYAAYAAAEEAEESPPPAESDQEATESPESAPEAGDGESDGEGESAPEGGTPSPEDGETGTDSPESGPGEAEPVEEAPVEETPVTETAAERAPERGVTEVQPELQSDEEEAPQVTDSSRPGETVVTPNLQSAEPADEEDEEESDEEGASETEEGSTRERQGGESTWSNALPFRGTRLVYENIFNAYQLSRDNDPTYNPYYAMSLSIAPRWYFTDAFSARLRFDIQGELTDADSTTEYHEVQVGDLTLDLVYNPVVTIPALEVDVGLGVRFQFPTSLQSQAETRYLGLGADLRLSRVFDVLDGLLIGYTFRYMKYLNRYTTLEAEVNPYEQLCTMEQPDCLAHNQTGDMARNHGFFNTIMISLEFLRERFRPISLTFMVSFINYLVYTPTDYSIELMGGELDQVEHDPTAQQDRAAVWYLLEIGIQITDYLGLSIGASTLNSQLRPDSTYREPFFNRYTNIYLDLSLDIERLVAAIRR